MQLALMRELSFIPERKVTSKNVILTSRDLEVIEFIIDMKFVSIEDVFQKFFKVTLSAESAKSDLWARKRLLQLEQGKFLKAHKVQTEKLTYYTATFKGYYALTNVYPEKAFTKPVGGFDHRTFAHDKLVLKCRLDLEERLKVTNWISDRKLKSSPELSGGLSSIHIPDAIYLTPSGQRVAFELEIARKSKSRYADKIKKYVQVMRSLDANKKKFDVVQIVCTQEPVFDLLVKETKIYGSLYKIQTMNQFINELAGGRTAGAQGDRNV